MSNIWLKNFLTRLFHWEYWNQKVVYAPLIPYYFWLSFKSRSFYFLTAANPSIRNGGLVMESKKEIYDLLPKKVYPTTIYFLPDAQLSEIINKIGNAKMQYPFIAKPDIGEKGLGVKKINDERELQDYAGRIPIPWLLQEYISYPLEAGIFYSRYPGQTKGFLTGIVFKEFAAVIGDGIHTIQELIMKNERLLLQWEYLKVNYGGKLGEVLANGEHKILIPYGNHVRGSKFTDHSWRINEKLTKVIDDLCSQIKGFFFGRLDVKFNTWEELEQGENYSVIEVNGCGSEPTHIYDPQHSIIFAWREVARHWSILYDISRVNKENGIKSLTLAEGEQQKKEHRKITALLLQAGI